MNKNTLCRTVLDIKEVLSNQVVETLTGLDSLTLKEKKALREKVRTVVDRNFDLVVDKILEG